MSGIRLFRFSYNNTISRNNITNNSNGIGLVDSGRNCIFGNSIKGNHLGVEFYRSSGNLLYHNNFVNPSQIRTFMSENVWDDGYPSGGNYWSDYTGVDLHSGPYQNEPGYDWIGDSPYVIDENDQDSYPLMYPFVPEVEEIRIAHRNLLLKYTEIHSDLEALNLTLYRLLGNITDLQGKYDSLLTTINDMQEQINSLDSACGHLQEQIDSMNSTSQISIDGLQEQVDLLNSTLQTSVSELQGLCNSLNSTLTSKQEAIINELSTVRNLMCVFIATTIILIATTVHSAIRKPKIRP
jgi:parallel beta-helix repeat protein